MSVRLRGDTVEHVELRIFEPLRFFEALLRGRSFLEAPDITARICGICPVAYQTSATNAMEDVCGVELPEPPRALRRLMYRGEWIGEPRAHVYMLHAPDFLGYDGAVEPARDEPAAVERGLQLKKTGNEVLARRRPRDPSGSTSGSAASTAHRRRVSCGRSSSRSNGPGRPRFETVRWTAGFDFLERAVEGESSRSPSPAATRSSAAGSSPTAASTSRPPSTTSTSSRSTSSA